jgi:hypothetical protein
MYERRNPLFPSCRPPFVEWDFWMWGSDRWGNAKWIDRGRSALSENDLRFEDYELKTDNWCRREHYFWTAQEAALISFSRDPDKVERSEVDFLDSRELPFYAEDDDNNDITLQEEIEKVYDAIVKAQADGVLWQRMPRDQYLEWAVGEGISIPDHVLKSVDDFESEAKDLDRSEEPLNSQEKRNLLLIIYGLLIEGKWVGDDNLPSDISIAPKSLFEKLAKEFKKPKYKSEFRPPSDQTIRNRFKDMESEINKARKDGGKQP